MIDLAALEQQYGLPAGLLAAIQGAEGSGPQSVSPKGAQGTFQFMPATAKAYGLTDPTDSAAAADAAARYMADAMKRYNTADPRVLMAEYNGGPKAATAVLNGGQPPAQETQAYIQKAPDVDSMIASLPGVGSKDPVDKMIAALPSVKQSGDDYSPMQAGVIAAGKTLTRLGQGAQQLYYGATGNTQAQDELAARVAEENRLYSPLAEAHPVATAVGEAAPTMVGGPVTMAAQGALEYGSPEERAIRAGAGYVGGKLGQYGGQLIGRVAQPIRAASNDAVDAAKAAFAKFDMPALPSQITQSAPLKWLESTLAALPGGGSVRDVLAAQQSGLNKGAMSAIGSAADAVTPETVEQALGRSGSNIGNLTSPFTVDVAANNYKLLQDVDSVAARYGNKLNSLQKPIIENLRDDIYKQGNQMSGEFYQNTASDIRSLARGADGNYKLALNGLTRALDDAFDRSVPSDVASGVKEARNQYRLGLAVDKMATPNGDISPVRLAKAFAGEPGDAGVLAQVAARLRPAPDSGTAQRLIYQGLLSGGLGAGAGLATGDPTEAMKYAGGSFVAPWLVSKALTRAPFRQYITNTLISDPVYGLLGRAGAIPGGLLGLQSAR